MVKNNKRIINRIIVILTAMALIIGTWGIRYHKGDTPVNPMNNKAKASKVYENDGLQVDEFNDYSNLQNSDNEDNEENNDSNDNSEETNNETDGNGNGNVNLKSTSNKSGNGKESADEGKFNKSKGKSFVDKVNQKTETLYFTTSIIDGETISTYEYAFTITHLVESLTVEQQLVYVNDEQINNFDGRVILKEGTNTIEIVVNYRRDDGREIIAKKKYTVNVDTGNLFISTDLKDQTVNNPFFKFNLQAKMGENDADVKVSLNGKNITGKDGKYSVILKKGKNTIVAKAEYDKYSITKKYEITLEYEDGFGIETDLENKTVNAENIEFQAVIRNGTDKAKLSVIVNGNIITGNEGAYTSGLKIGNNTIRLKATDSGNVSLNKIFTIKYVPLATKDTEPVISYINVTDGMEVKGESFTLYIGAMDYKKNKIYYDGIEVKLNGKKIQYRWSANYVGYLLNLQNGDNSLEVKITDSDGRYKEYSYKLKCTYIDEGTVIGTATVSIDAKVIHLGVLLRPKTVDIYYGDNAADIFERAIEKSGFSYTNSGTVDKGFYLETISRPGILRGWMIDEKLKDEIIEDGLQFNIDPSTGEYIYDMDSLGQLDFCQGSGWAYSVNDEYKEYGMSEYKPKDGDDIKIRYTLAYGKDIGGYNPSSGSYGIKDKYSVTY